MGGIVKLHSCRAIWEDGGGAAGELADGDLPMFTGTHSMRGKRDNTWVRDPAWGFRWRAAYS